MSWKLIIEEEFVLWSSLSAGLRDWVPLTAVQAVQQSVHVWHTSYGSRSYAELRPATHASSPQFMEYLRHRSHQSPLPVGSSSTSTDPWPLQCLEQAVIYVQNQSSFETASNLQLLERTVLSLHLQWVKMGDLEGDRCRIKAECVLDASQSMPHYQSQTEL